jgi:hypothetical protein
LVLGFPLSAFRFPLSAFREEQNAAPHIMWLLWLMADG